ncbi:MAG TPA: GNAT family N-acetyltransferase [Bacteroidia bacterium]|jgi:ribosomal protein S18 acetylase RimI-like enzyme
MELSYRKAGKEDVALIAQLADNIWRKHYITIISMEQIDFMLETMYSSESLLKQMNEGHQFTLVYDDEKAVGYISISTKDHKNYFLHKFYVEVSDQGKGVGSALLRHLLIGMPEGETIELTVNRRNYKAINFYFKNGFTIKAIADFDIGRGYFMNDFIMQKKIK